MRCRMHWSPRDRLAEAVPAVLVSYRQRAEKAEARGTCDWSLDSDGSWFAECGHYWVFEDGTPVDQGMKFCPLCGKVLNQLPAKWDEFGDPIMNDDE